jgi:hypothetical protein
MRFGGTGRCRSPAGVTVVRMKQINLGSQGLRVPAIGLGCMGMSDFYGSSSEAENLRVLDRAAEIGCTFWDTADMYGPFKNEILLSKALKNRRGQITLATKFGVSRGEDGSWRGIKGSAEYVKASCDASLKRLETDYIDLYYQHRLDPQTPIEETVGAMAELVKAGKVRYIVVARGRGRRPSRPSAARHRLRGLQPARPRVPVRGGALTQRSRAGRLASGQPPLHRRGHRQEQPAGGRRRRDRQGDRGDDGAGGAGLAPVT